MKKMVALLLALVMVLSLCTVAFATTTPIEQVELSYHQLTLEELKNLTTKDATYSITNIVASPTGLNDYINSLTYFFFNTSNELLFDFYANGGWYDEVNNKVPQNVSDLPFDDVAKVNVSFYVGNTSGNTDNFFTDSTTVSLADGGTLTKGDAYMPTDFNQYNVCYEEPYGYSEIAVHITYDVEQEDDDTHCNLLPLIGLYWTAKYVCGLVKEASTMPYLAPIVKLAVPTAAAMLCLKAISHAVWHLR